MWTYLKDYGKGALYTVGGAALCATGIGAVIGAPLMVAGSYTAGKAVIRAGRECAEEKDGDTFIVFYDHPVHSHLSVVGYVLPEIPLFDLYAGSNNSKIAHAKAWFSLGPDRFVTIEITFGADTGVKREKDIIFRQ